MKRHARLEVDGITVLIEVAPHPMDLVPRDVTYPSLKIDVREKQTNPFVVSMNGFVLMDFANRPAAQMLCDQITRACGGSSQALS